MTLIAIVHRRHCCVKLPMNNFSSGLPNNFLYYEIWRPSIYYFLHVLWSKYVIPLAIGHSYCRGLVGNHKSMATVFIVFFWKPWGHSINNWSWGVPLPATYDFWEDTTYSVMSPSLERTHSLILSSYWSPQAFHLGVGPCSTPLQYCVDWHCHYAAFVLATILLEDHGRIFSRAPSPLHMS